MGDIITTSESQFFISSAAAASTVDTLAEYEGLTWIELGDTEDLGEVGDTSAEVTGVAISEGRVRKAKGARNAGNMQIICFHQPLDAGQQAFRDAEQTKDNYAFKLVLPDTPSGGGTPTTQYFRGLVTSQPLRMGTADNIMRRVFNISVNSALTEEPANTV
jgi:hypothetical protein